MSRWPQEREMGAGIDVDVGLGWTKEMLMAKESAVIFKQPYFCLGVTYVTHDKKTIPLACHRFRIYLPRKTVFKLLIIALSFNKQHRLQPI